jgi:transcriptional regulator with XRE-family HTH domain
MNGMGARMKARARELGLSDTKVAERAGLAQTRYAAYAVDKYEPDLGTLMRICRVLHVTPNDLLGWVIEGENAGAGDVRHRIVANLSALEPDMLKVVNTITTALAASTISEDE